MTQLVRWYLCSMLLWAAPIVAWAKIEAIKGKKYELSKAHGPWMIMVASLAEPPPKYRVDGPGPADAASDLVFELRKKGIPAYIVEQSENIEPLTTYNRNGKTVRRGVRTQNNRICVVAGNYSSSDDSVAQKTLAYLKNYKPESFAKHAVFRPTPGRPSPLSGAFLTINPLLSAEEVAQRKVDPLLLKLNGDRKYSLLNNRDKYTLIVASFYGKAKLENQSPNEKDPTFGKTLDEAGLHAELLCRALRETELHRGRTHEAFVWHERDRSHVCVGSFSSDRDPRISMAYQLFAECKQIHPQTKTEVVLPQSMNVPELDRKRWIVPKLPTAITGGKKVDPLPKHTFPFNPKPQLLVVPLSGSR